MTHPLFIAYRSDDVDRGWFPVGRLEYGNDAGGYRFLYTLGAKTGFQPFPGMPDLNVVYESQTLFPLFANRLLGQNRPEYDDFLRWSGFDPNTPPDPIAILSVTEGRRATDSLELFPCPVPDNNGCYINKFFLHGLRHATSEAIERASQLKTGEVLGMMLDISNKQDRNAVAVRTCDTDEQHLMGYVPRYLARDVQQIAKQCESDDIVVKVVRVNADAPLQHRVLCCMCACWPENFKPCDGAEFQPIVAN